MSQKLPKRRPSERAVERGSRASLAGNARHFISKLGPLRRERAVRSPHLASCSRGQPFRFSCHRATFCDTLGRGKAYEFRSIESRPHYWFPFAVCGRARHTHAQVCIPHVPPLRRRSPLVTRIAESRALKTAEKFPSRPGVIALAPDCHSVSLFGTRGDQRVSGPARGHTGAPRR